MKKVIYCLIALQSLSVITVYSQSLDRDAFFDFVLSDTSGEDKRELFVKLKLLDQNHEKAICVTYNDSLYVTLKRKYGYDFLSYKILMKKIFRGDTLLPYTYFSEKLINDFVKPISELDSAWKEGAYNFLTEYTCKNQIIRYDHWNVLSYLFDINITNDYSNGGIGHLVYFNPEMEKAIQGDTKRNSEKIIYNDDGSLRGKCGELSVLSKEDNTFVYREERCDHWTETAVKAYIVGSKNNTISVTAIRSGFTLKLTDSSYTLKSFHVSTNAAGFDNPAGVYFEGNKMDSYESASFFSREGATVFIDDIRVSKGGKCYRLSSFSYQVTK